MTFILEACNITKQFSGVLANDNVNFSLEKGEIHALLGENGAGKTTLMNILYGLEKPDTGEIRIDGKLVNFSSPKDALRQGIGMVHQHFMLVPVFTVTENIVLGIEQTRKGFGWLGRIGLLEQKSSQSRIRELSEQLGLSVEPHQLVGDLPVGIQQKVEIVKALYRGAQTLILDEPTAVLTPQEVMELFEILRSLTLQGMSVILITHKLKEVLAVSDRISVMRQGKIVSTVKISQTNEIMLAEMMVGRKVILQVEKTLVNPGDRVCQVSNLYVLNDQNQTVVDGVDLTIHAGEILGIAGVQGNGQTELVEALTGLRRVAKGNVVILGKDTTHSTPRQILETGVAHVPEDREKYGLVGSYSLIDNMVLSTYYQPPFAKGIVLQSGAMLLRSRFANAEYASRMVKEFDVRPPVPQYQAGTLSGGNKQKLILARELSREAKLLIASQPSRGVDVGSIEFIHKWIVAVRDRGMGVLLVSAELDEILALSDRVAVMFKGKILQTLPIAEATRERLGLLMTGVVPE